MEEGKKEEDPTFIVRERERGLIKSEKRRLKMDSDDDTGKKLLKNKKLTGREN